MNSLRFLTGTSALTTYRLGTLANSEMGLKSLLVSNGNLSKMNGFHSEGADMAQDQCVAVGALRALCHGNVAACAGLVFDKYGLAQRFAEFAGRRPRHNFRAAALRKWDQQANRFGWPGGLRACWQGAGSCRGGGGLQGGAAVGVRGSRHG